MSAFDELREALGTMPDDPPEIHWRAPNLDEIRRQQTELELRRRWPRYDAHQS